LHQSKLLNNNPIIINIEEYHHQQTVINNENKRYPMLPISNMKYQQLLQRKCQTL